MAHLKARKPFTGCNAGHTFFHVDPHARASICKVGRDEQISLVDEGVDSLARMGHRGQADASIRGMLWLRPVRNLHCMPTVGEALPAGEGLTEVLLPARKEEGVITAVTVKIGRHPGDTQEAGEGPLESVPDLEVYLEHAMCSCNASDDNPY